MDQSQPNVWPPTFQGVQKEWLASFCRETGLFPRSASRCQMIARVERALRRAFNKRAQERPLHLERFATETRLVLVSLRNLGSLAQCSFQPMPLTNFGSPRPSGERGWGVRGPLPCSRASVFFRSWRACSAPAEALNCVQRPLHPSRRWGEGSRCGESS